MAFRQNGPNLFGYLTSRDSMMSMMNDILYEKVEQ